MSEIINHEEAEHLAILKQGESNLARCYLDALDELRSLREELANLKEGRTAVMPQTKEHAEILLAVAEACYYGNDKIQGFAPRKPKA